MRALFLHGWGFGPDVWVPVLDRLGWNGVMTPDLGFLDAVRPHADEALERIRQDGCPVLAVGHSLGFLWLASQDGWPAGSRFVGINAFGCFAARADFAQGTAPRILARMLKGLQTDARDVVNAFRTTCGATALPTDCPVNTDHLRVGLDMLMQADARKRLASMAEGIGVLGGRQDKVVPPAMLAASLPPETTIEWLEGGHLLPLTNPDECARFLRGMARHMEQPGA
ncbi:alpha/beta hydrolase [Acetobacter sp. TBRC 12305]|uniref:Alpha/beta fold hydrolase n=2 Tax=Acetobacter garciniae TaxID=2817435 RepID=A0A939HL56_9PROT|nr:alpha/beta hydrolase [Acetobacter garciniae]MBO1324081.1 alpha/beta fold hydrolase [Acetobacter garciniae]MBX0343770.1 alpha/beta hydrolase [Acetobacter garciniae]